MKVGLIGTGLMGQPMALRLVEANFEVIAYNRTASKLEPLKASGVQVADSPQVLISAKESTALGLNSSSLEGVKSLIEVALELGKADDDYSALFEGIKPQ